MAAVPAREEDEPTDPSAGAVLRGVLARSARRFLANDTSDDVIDEERIHQARVALRRIRSNLRTFRLLVDPAWGTSLRAELAWYADRLGESRDLHILAGLVAASGPPMVDDGHVDAVLAVIADAQAAADRRVAEARRSDRRSRLAEQIMLLQDGPVLTAKAGKPADEILPPLLQRTWRDARGAARAAKKDPTDDNLHKLRIRLKGLRYGCETVAIVEGGPARKTARAAERLQSRLGDLHDACVSIEWLQSLGAERPELIGTTEQLIATQRTAAAAARKGWKNDVKEIERRWRGWQG